MDFIERLFGISPDGGSGATEATYIVALVVGALLLSFQSRIRKLAARVLERLARTSAR